MEAEVTERLARFASEVKYEEIPPRVRERCKDLLLDALACALAGHLGDETPRVFAVAAALGRSEESAVVGGGRLSLAGATLFNGFLVTAVSMCDVHRATATHLTPVIVSPALAVAERDSASGRDLLVALAAGLETATRIGAGLDYPAFRSRGWHGPGTIGPFGAAVAVGRLLGLDPDRMAVALGLAGSQAAGTFAAWGTPSVKFHQCRGALSGLLAALMAGQGFVATRRFLTAPDGGFYPTYCGGGPREVITAGLGEGWVLEEISLRPWPCAAAAQGVVTALFDLLRRHDLRAEQTRCVRIALSKSVFDAYAGRRTFSGKWQAASSIYYTATAVLHDGELWLDQFEPSRYDDPELRRFATEGVALRCDPELSGVQTLVEVERTDGSVVAARCDFPKGDPENPLARSEIEDKFRRGARGRLSPEAADAVIETISHLEELESVPWLMDALSTTSRAER